MTQEELRKEIDDLLGSGDNGKYAVDWTESLMDIINQHVKEVIGEFEDGRSGVNTSYYNSGSKEQNARNELRVEQRKRAGL